MVTAKLCCQVDKYSTSLLGQSSRYLTSYAEPALPVRMDSNNSIFKCTLCAFLDMDFPHSLSSETSPHRTRTQFKAIRITLVVDAAYYCLVSLFLNNIYLLNAFRRKQEAKFERQTSALNLCHRVLSISAANLCHSLCQFIDLSHSSFGNLNAFSNSN